MFEQSWPTIMLGSVADVVDPHPSHRAPSEVEQGVPFVGIGDISEAGEINIDSARKVRHSVIAEHRARYKIEPGDIGYGRVATVGKVIRFGLYNFDFALSPTMALVKPHGIDASFLVQYLQSEEPNKAVSRLLTGTTRSSLGIQLLRKLEITAPATLDEQRAIGKIFDTLDTTISKTEAIIAKLQQLKQGLLHDLLTRGIDANGELRPPVEVAPHLYKESPLGWIPKEWDVIPLGQCAFVTKLAGFEYTNYFDYAKGGEITVVRVLNIKAGTLDLTDIHRIPRTTSNLLPRSKLFAGDLVLSYVGTIGEVAIIPDNNKFHLAPNVAKITVDNASLKPKFLCLYLLSEYGKKRLINLATITSQPSISMSRVRQLLVPVPSLSEQNTAAKMIDSINNQLIVESEKLGKLISEKSGLMDDLLTGGVRVTPLLNQ